MIENLSNLDQGEMYYHGDGTAEDGVHPEFCRVPHAIMATIPCNGDATLNGL